MNLLGRAKKILAPASTIGRLPFRTLTLVTSVGLLVGYGSVASAVTSPVVPIIQEHEDEDQNVKLHKLIGNSDGEVDVVVVKDGDSIHQELVTILKSENLGQLHELAADADGNVEVVIIQDGDSKGHHGMLKKLKTELKGQIHEVISDAGDNIEVIVVGEGKSDHQGLLKKLKLENNVKVRMLHSDSDGEHNVFVLKDGDQEVDVKIDIHEHLAELLHGQKSGKMNHQALATKLRQMADRLETKNNEPHSAHEPHGKIEIHSDGDHKFHFEKHGNHAKSNHKIIEFKTDSGNHIVIGKPGVSGGMVIDLKPEFGGKLHSHDGDHKTIVLHGKEHGAEHNVIVEEIHLDEAHSPSDVAKKVLGRLKKKHSQKHNIVIDEVHKHGDSKAHSHESHVIEAKRSHKGLDASLRDLRNELKDLRRELKELQSDGPDRRNH